MVALKEKRMRSLGAATGKFVLFHVLVFPWGSLLRGKCEPAENTESVRWFFVVTFIGGSIAVLVITSGLTIMILWSSGVVMPLGVRTKDFWRYLIAYGGGMVVYLFSRAFLYLLDLFKTLGSDAREL